MQGPSSTRERIQVLSLSALLFFFSLGIFAYSKRNPWTYTVGTTISAQILWPFQVVHRYIFAALTNGWDEYVAVRGIRVENVKLLERLKSLEQRNAQFEEALSENSNLKSLLEVKKTIGGRSVGAAVVGYDPSPWVRIMIVDKGSDQGILPGSPVLVDGGLVGQIVAVGKSQSRVRMLNDHNSKVDVLIQGSRARGILQGDGDKTLLLYVEKNQDTKIGDTVVTSGLDGLYPKGILVGTVDDVSVEPNSLFQNISVATSVDVGSLEFVLISIPSEPEATPEKSGRKK